MEFSGQSGSRADCLQLERKETVAELKFQNDGSGDCALILIQY
jgi:hypothetical protein